MKTVELNLSVHGGNMMGLIWFRPDGEITSAIEQIDSTKWSQSQKSW